MTLPTIGTTEVTFSRVVGKQSNTRRMPWLGSWVGGGIQSGDTFPRFNLSLENLPYVVEVSFLFSHLATHDESDFRG